MLLKTISKLPKISPDRSVLNIKRKESILDTPIFREDDGERTTYSSLRKRLDRLGRVTGYQEVLTRYCLRRSFADAIHGNVTESQQDQAMNHTSIAIFNRYYQNSVVKTDVQNCFLGLPRREKLIKVVGSMRSTLDRLRPTKLTEKERQAAYQDEDVQAASRAGDLAKARCQQLVKSRGTEEHQAFINADSLFRRRTSRIMRQDFEKAQADCEKAASSNAIHCS